MDIKDFVEFSKQWNTMREVFGKPPLKSELAEMIFGDLAEYPLDAVKQAMRKARMECSFCPAEADVIKALKAIAGTDADGMAAKAQKFWHELMGDFAPTVEIVCSDRRAAVAFVQCFGGMAEYATRPGSSRPFDEKAFVQKYVAVSEAEVKAGSHVIHGWYQGVRGCLYRFIGDKAACAAICRAMGKAPHFLPDGMSCKEIPVAEGLLRKPFNGVEFPSITPEPDVITFTKPRIKASTGKKMLA